MVEIMVIYFFIIGLIIGSFLNVCIYRIGIGKSIVSPPSSCQKCGKQIKFYDNIPVISYIILKGKCRSCGEKISMRYPAIEILTGVLFAAAFISNGYNLELLSLLTLIAFLITLSFIDLDHFMLPEQVTILMLFSGIMFSMITNIKLENAISGSIIYFSVIFIIFMVGEILKREIMGLGDAYLCAGIGSFIGFNSIKYLYLFFMISFILGAVTGIILIVIGKKTRKDVIPFGPYLAVSGFIMALWGDGLVKLLG